MKLKSAEKLFRLAYTDMLTGVANRNAYEEKLKYVRKSHAAIRDITVVVADLNGLKYINDNYGHHTGDEALKIVANALQKTIGKKGEIYRVGGDEFVCLITGKTLGCISEFRDHIAYEREALSYRLSVSLGYVTYNDSFGGDIDLMIKHCDRLMYADKKRSKNRC